jgi:hypothetical protein
MVEELTAELEDSERATYASWSACWRTKSTTRWPPPARCSTRCCTTAPAGRARRRRLRHRHRRRQAPQHQPGRIHRPLHAGGQDAGAGTAAGQPAGHRRRHPLAEPRTVQARGIQLGWSRCDDVAPAAAGCQLMEQALLNIVKNAVEAVEAQCARRRPGGHPHLELEAGRRARALSVIDSGDLLGDAPAPAVHAFLQHQARRPGHRPDVRARGAGRHGCAYALAPARAGRDALRYLVSGPKSGPEKTSSRVGGDPPTLRRLTDSGCPACAVRKYPLTSSDT